MQTEHLHTPATQQPLVSFVLTYSDMPVELLTRCIDSILALSLRASEKEIIVVDDGSPLSPLPQLSAYQEQIIYIRQPNQGLSAARNTGIRLACGQYLQFVDADDMLIRTPYEHCLDIMRYEKPDIVMFGQTDRPTEESVFEDLPVMSGVELMRNHNIHGSACGYLFKKSALSQLRFTPSILHEDEEFTPLLLLRADTVVKTQANAYLYTQRSQSIMNSTNVRHRLKRLNDFKDILTRLNRMADTLPTESRLALERRVHQMTMDYLYNVIRLTQSRHYLNRRLKELGAIGLYPLPKRDYTRKYAWFRRLANSEIGLSMLMRAIPLAKKER